MRRLWWIVPLLFAFTTPSAPVRHPTSSNDITRAQVYIYDPYVGGAAAGTPNVTGKVMSASPTCGADQALGLYDDGGVVGLNCLDVAAPIAAPTVSGFCPGGSGPTVTWSRSGTTGTTGLKTVILQLDVGGTCAASTGTITVPAATNGWTCDCHNITAAGLTRRVEQAGGSGTTCTLQSVSQTTGLALNWTDGDDVRCELTGD